MNQKCKYPLEITIFLAQTPIMVVLLRPAIPLRFKGVNTFSQGKEGHILGTCALLLEHFGVQPLNNQDYPQPTYKDNLEHLELTLIHA